MASRKDDHGVPTERRIARRDSEAFGSSLIDQFETLCTARYPILAVTDPTLERGPWINSYNVLVIGLLLGGIYGLVSIGLNLIFGVVRIVNFAQGELVMFGMYGCYWAYAQLGLNPVCVCAGGGTIGRPAWRGHSALWSFSHCTTNRTCKFLPPSACS
jgi:hypothetical protein